MQVVAYTTTFWHLYIYMCLYTDIYMCTYICAYLYVYIHIHIEILASHIHMYLVREVSSICVGYAYARIRA